MAIEQIQFEDGKKIKHTALIETKGAKLIRYITGENIICPDFEGLGGYGDVLYPFPSRIEDGKYTFEGVQYQLPINEKARNVAIHGFARENEYKVIEKEVNSISLQFFTKDKRDGYPFETEFIVTYSLSDKGLSIRFCCKNTDIKNAPIAIGFHPYFSPLGFSLDECELLIPARTSVVLDDRLLPVENIELNEKTDFTSLKKIGGAQLDNAWINVVKDGDKPLPVIFKRPDGSKTSIYADSNLRAWQVYIPPNRKAIAIEPMTCVSNCFNTKDFLVTLKPNEQYNFNILIHNEI